MDWQYVPYLLPLGLATATSIVLALYAWKHRRVSGGKAFVLMMAAVAIWSFLYALRLSAVGLEQKLLWAKLRYLGILVVPTAWFVFALRYAGMEKWLSRRGLLLLAVEPVTVFSLVMTNEWHRLFWSSYWVDTQGPFATFSSSHGTAFWGHTAYSYVLVIGGTIFLVQTVIRSPRLYRLQALTLLASAVSPLIGNIVSVFGLSPFPHLDLTPFAFTLTGIGLTYALFRFRLLDIVPVARDRVIEGMRDGVVVLDAGNRVVDINPAACQLIGCDSEGAIGMSADEVFSAWPNLVSQYRGVDKAQTEIQIDKGREPRSIDLRISPLRDRRGAPSGRLIMLSDITARKKVQAELQQATKTAEDANRAKDEFISLVAHELRTPMNSIMGSAELIACEVIGPVNEDQIDCLEIIDANVSRMSVLVSDLSDMSRIETGDFSLKCREMSISKVVDAVTQSIQPQIDKREQTLETDVPDDLPMIWADPVRVEQILMNLLSNAWKFTPEEKGRICLRAECVEDRWGENGEGRVIHLMVEDNGIGIREEDRSKVFDRFFRSGDETGHIPGTGLGLSISRSLVEMHGGRIWFESEVQGGTTFHFTIPVGEKDK